MSESGRYNSFLTAVGAGAGVWLVGLLLTFVVGMLQVSLALSLLTSLAPLAGTVMAWMLLHSWFVAGGGITPLLMALSLLPIVLLVLAGFASGYYNDTRAAGWIAGLFVTVGYLPMAILSTILAVAMSSGGGRIGGSFLVMFVFAGLVYPLVFGTLGGALSDLV